MRNSIWTNFQIEEEQPTKLDRQDFELQAKAWKKQLAHLSSKPLKLQILLQKWDPEVRDNVAIFKLYLSMKRELKRLPDSRSASESLFNEALSLFQTLQTALTSRTLQVSKSELNRFFYVTLKSLLRTIQCKRYYKSPYQEQLRLLAKLVVFLPRGKRWKLLYFQFRLLQLHYLLQTEDGSVEDRTLDLFDLVGKEVVWVLTFASKSRIQLDKLNNRLKKYLLSTVRLLIAVLQCLLQHGIFTGKLRVSLSAIRMCNYLAQHFLTPGEKKNYSYLLQTALQNFGRLIAEQNDLMVFCLVLFEKELKPVEKQTYVPTLSDYYTQLLGERLEKMQQRVHFEAEGSAANNEKESIIEKSEEQTAFSAEQLLSYSAEDQSELLVKYGGVYDSTKSFTTFKVKRKSKMSSRQKASLPADQRQLQQKMMKVRLQSQNRRLSSVLRLRLPLQFQRVEHIECKYQSYLAQQSSSSEYPRVDSQKQQKKNYLLLWKQIILKHRNVFPLTVFRAKLKKNEAIDLRKEVKLVKLSNKLNFREQTKNILNLYERLNRDDRRLILAQIGERSKAGPEQQLNLRRVKRSLLQSVRAT